MSAHGTHSLIHKLFQDPVQFVPHVVHVLLYVVLGVVPLLLELVLHDHLPLKEPKGGCYRDSEQKQTL